MTGVIAAVDQLVGRARLAPDPQARRVGETARTLDDIATQQVENGARGLFGDDLLRLVFTAFAVSGG